MRRLKQEKDILWQERAILKSQLGLLTRRPHLRYWLIADQAKELRVKTMCRVLKVSKSGYYAWGKRGSNARARANVVLVEEIHEAHLASRRLYGSGACARRCEARAWSVTANGWPGRCQNTAFEVVTGVGGR